MLGRVLRQFRQVDVFTTAPFLGNPVAVVLDAEGLDAGKMQTLARWTNLSETTFVLPATSARADYQVRIFTPDAELPFAGHPTLGTCHAWREAGGAPTRPGVIVQQCAWLGRRAAGERRSRARAAAGRGQPRHWCRGPVPARIAADVRGPRVHTKARRQQ